ncbi:MAG TPA: LuxR C-terminal-related transcriptional regulator [Ktedonobacteraceae bacterium]|nr:LuxR C-terminal-related transcriptional regulator [Ktedonobacteraceae bacterium]
MSTPILATKLYIPLPRPKVVSRPRLIERLNEGLQHKLILVSASAGFGKTTLISEWVLGCGRPTAWLSLDEGENDPVGFLRYLVAALQTIAPSLGEGVLALLQSPQPPPITSILTALLNDMASIKEHFVLILDDYHMLDSKAIDQALTFLVEHLPPQMHLVIATREDPSLPLARLRVQDQLTEVRAAELRFTHLEAAAFLNQVMGLTLSAQDIAALERRTEGWIAGLQLAALSMQGQQDVTSFITSFTGSHHFVLDYLLEEVLQQQSERIQTFLLRTSILDRLCGPLCDAVVLDPAVSGRETLHALERANLFIVPLDNERHWYRYHHLFADLLRQRLHQMPTTSSGDEGVSVAELHQRASGWYEEHGLEIEAFHHATVANDIERAERLIVGKWMPLHFRGAVAPVLHWLESLPKAVLDARPTLWVMYASALSMTNHLTSVEAKLQAAEVALQGAELDDKARNLVGHIAAIRALLAATQYQVETVIAQSHRALEYLHPDNLAVRTATIWKLGFAYQLQGDRAAARQSYTEAIAICQASGNIIINISATIGLGIVQEVENELSLAAETYRRALQLAGDPPRPSASEAYFGLARIFYQWNDLDAAYQHGQQGLQLMQPLETDRYIACEVFLALLKLARGDVTGAAALLAEAAQSARQHHFTSRMPEIASAQVLTLLHQGNLAAAAHLAQTHELPISQARVHLAQGDTSVALTVLERWRQHVEAKGWEDERLKAMVLQVVALQTHGEKDKAMHLLFDALSLAEPSGFIRLFVDEGLPMARLLSEAAAQGLMTDYIGKLQAACAAEMQMREDKSPLSPPAQPLIEPLSQRELEVLQLIAQGLSNQEMSERLFLALDTVKGHNRKIFSKLQVQRRTEAVARARQLGLL